MFSFYNYNKVLNYNYNYNLYFQPFNNQIKGRGRRGRNPTLDFPTFNI